MAKEKGRRLHRQTMEKIRNNDPTMFDDDVLLKEAEAYGLDIEKD